MGSVKAYLSVSATIQFGLVVQPDVAAKRKSTEMVKVFNPYENEPKSAADLQNVINSMEAYYQTGATLPASFRIQQLRQLQAYLLGHEAEALEALHADLGKSEFESYATELGLVYDELRNCIANVRKWSRPKRVPTSLAHFPTTSHIYAYPFGVAAVLSPWNYPLQLSLIPLIDAISAGNCVVLKPSQQSVHTSAFLMQLCREVFDPKFVVCLHGSNEMNDWILQVSFDKIMFTGSPGVGKKIMEHAAQSLTSVTLELGGKNPLFITEDADVKRAGERVAWGKCLNSGQTCVAPDYALVHESVVDSFIAELTHSIHKYYGEHPLNSPDYPHMINKKHYDMVCGLIDGCGPDAKIVCGGNRNPETLQIEPTVMTGVKMTDPLMAQEIFGPVLPIIVYSNLEDAIEVTRSYGHPLGCYIFTKSPKTYKHIMDKVPSGGVTINDVVIWASSTHLPFGGLQNSGIGSYHGKAGFDAFTHYRSTMKKSNLVELPIRNPPFNETKIRLLKFFMPPK